MLSFLREYLEFLRRERKTWMLLIILVLLAVGGLVTFTSSAVAPFIYALF